MTLITLTRNQVFAAALLCILVMCAGAGAAFSQSSTTPAAAAAAPRAQEPAAEKIVTKISVVGGHNTKRSLILSRLDISPGDVFDPDRVERGLERLKALPSVKAAMVRVLADLNGDGIELAIVISDEDTRILRPTLSRAVTNDWSVGVCFEELNMRGVGEELSARLLLGGAVIAEASYLKPWLLEQEYVGAGLSIRYTDYDYPYPDYRAMLIDKRVGRFEAAGEIRINLTDRLHLALRPGVDIIDVADTMAMSDQVPPTPSGTFTTFAAALSIDLLDRRFYPTKGFRAEGGRKDWGVIQEESEIKNFRYWAGMDAYYSVWRLIGVVSARGEITKGANVPLLLRSHLGGEGTIRGYDFGVLEGENSLLINSELRLPLNFTSLYDPKNPFILLDFHVFLDSGACWSEPDSFTADLFHSGFGCGVNIIPVRKGMLTVDYAWQMKTSGVWSFNAGFLF